MLLIDSVGFPFFHAFNHSSWPPNDSHQVMETASVDFAMAPGLELGENLVNSEPTDFAKD